MRTIAPIVLLGLGLALGACVQKRSNTPTPTTPPGATAPRPLEQPPPSLPADPAAADDGVEYATPCVDGTKDYAEARGKLDALDRTVEALTPHLDPKHALEELDELLEHACFRLAYPDSPDLEADSGLALKTWWDAGGSAWLEHYLALGRHDRDTRPTSWVAPTMRTTLARETDAKHPLFSLLCSVHDEPCGPRTRGWVKRAKIAFERHAISRLQGRGDDAQPTVESCEKSAVEAKSRERYSTWRDCLGRLDPKTDALPLAGMRAPTRGWLVIRGRRGHYSFCDEIRAYDLRTGAAFVSQSCSGLALTTGGGVDHRRTDDARKPKTKVGKVPLDNLREAAWMTLLTNDTQERVLLYGFGRSMPEGVEPRQPALTSHGMGFSASFSSAQTRLSWTYVVAGKPIASGELTWPEHYNSGAKDHAVKLLQIAEAGLVEGCAPARLPKLDLGKSSAGVSGLDADPQSLRQAKTTLEQALDKLRKTRVCRR